jgi:hypothetical protein
VPISISIAAAPEPPSATTGMKSGPCAPASAIALPIAAVPNSRRQSFDYLSLETDYGTLVGVEHDIAAYLRIMPNTFGFGGLQQTVVLAKAQGALSNFLASASAFRDRGETRLRERYGTDSVQWKQLKTTMSHAYDASFAYRLLYALRNYGQHHDSPLSKIPAHGERKPPGELEFEVSLALVPKEMLRSAKIPAKIRAELSAQPDEIPLIPFVKECFSLHGTIMKAVIDMHVPRLIQFQHYGQVVLMKLGVPHGAVPVIWEGEDRHPPKKLCHFSFDEFAFVHRLYQNLSGPATA